MQQSIQLSLCLCVESPDLQKRLSALPPTLRTMKTDYASLRSQVRNFSDFYGTAIKEAKKQVLQSAQTCTKCRTSKI